MQNNSLLGHVFRVLGLCFYILLSPRIAQLRRSQDIVSVVAFPSEGARKCPGKHLLQKREGAKVEFRVQGSRIPSTERFHFVFGISNL